MKIAEARKLDPEGKVRRASWGKGEYIYFNEETMLWTNYSETMYQGSGSIAHNFWLPYTETKEEPPTESDAVKELAELKKSLRWKCCQNEVPKYAGEYVIRPKNQTEICCLQVMDFSREGVDDVEWSVGFCGLVNHANFEWIEVPK